MNWASRVVAAVFVAGVFVSGATQAETIRFGAILPLTGPGALIGALEMHGIMLAIDQANAKGGVAGNKIEVVFEDNQAKPDQSIISFNKMVDLQHMPVIFTGYSGPTLAMAPLATRKKVLLVNAGAQADALGKASPYLINTLPAIGDEVAVLSKYLAGEGKKKAVVLFENDAAGISGRDDYNKYFPATGGTIVAQEPTQFGQTDYRPALLKLADAKPEVMLVAITAGLQQLAQQYRQLNLGFTVAGTSFFADPETIADPAANGFIHTQIRMDATPALAAEFKQKYGTDMAFLGREYYTAGQIVLTTLAKVLADKKPVTGENMRAALFEIRTFEGLVPVEFKTNTASSEIDIAEIRDGRDVVLKSMKPD
jgi:branched-chain amino acid transport system substrate-binding protein